MTKNYFQQQGDFFTTMGSPSLLNGNSLKECCELSESLINEEVVNETLPALRKYQTNPSLENLTELADGIVDSVYVLLHAAHSLGIPFDACWNEVHRSNMAKINPDGSVTRREDGKILKPAGWTPPNLHSIMLDWDTTRQYGESYHRKGMVS